MQLETVISRLKKAVVGLSAEISLLPEDVVVKLSKLYVSVVRNSSWLSHVFFNVKCIVAS